MFKILKSLKSNRKDYEVISFEKLVNQIKSPDTNVEAARTAGKPSKAYDLLKENIIPCYYPNDLDGKSTGYIYLDIDGFNNSIEATEYRTSLLSNPNTVDLIHACWLSLSNKGLSILVQVDDLNPTNYDQYWNSLNQLFNNRLDTQAKGYNKLNCISSDPSIYLNTNSKVFKLDTIQQGGSKHCYIQKGNNNHIVNPLPQELKPVFWSTQLPDSVYEDINTPVYYPEGIDYLKINLRQYLTNKIQVGLRHKIIGAICLQLLAINPEADRRQLFNAILSINSKYCQTPLTKKEVIGIFNANYKKYLTTGIDVSKYVVKKYVWYHHQCQLPKADRISITKRLLGASAKEAKEQLIYDTIELLISQNKKVTRKEIIELTSLSESTLKRYWKPFKGMIDEHNSILTPKTVKTAKTIKLNNTDMTEELKSKRQIAIKLIEEGKYSDLIQYASNDVNRSYIEKTLKNTTSTTHTRNKVLYTLAMYGYEYLKVSYPTVLNNEVKYDLIDSDYEYQVSKQSRLIA